MICGTSFPGSAGTHCMAGSAGLGRGGASRTCYEAEPRNEFEKSKNRENRFRYVYEWLPPAGWLLTLPLP